MVHSKSTPMDDDAYWMVAGGRVHYLEAAEINNVVPDILIDPVVEDWQSHDANMKMMNIRNKNLLYKLNNPSGSDLDSDNIVDPAKASASPEHSTPPSTGGSTNNGSTVKIPTPAHSLYMPRRQVDLVALLAAKDKVQDSSEAENVKTILLAVMQWPQDANIKIKFLTGGITNMLLSCSYGQSTVLMRVYGQGTNLIIDRHREYILHLVLNSLQLAPPVYARFSNGLVYGYLPGRSLEPKELYHPALYPLIAQLLGIWHHRVSSSDIEDGVEKLRRYAVTVKKRRLLQLLPVLMAENSKKKKKPKKKTINNVWELLHDWIDVVPLNQALRDSFARNKKIDSDLREVVRQELNWLEETLTSKNSSPVVSAHCDLLSGNVIIPTDFAFEESDLPSVDNNPIKFIDYEYMLPAPRAFDIANHMAEWQGFHCDRSAIPEPSMDNPVMVKWVRSYLNNPDAGEDEVRKLIDEIALFYGMPGFYWGIWAMIQSEISQIDFDYADYGKLRLEEYWDWKVKHLSSV